MKVFKMHGLGNDFILAMQSEVEAYDLPQLAKTLCARRVNIGADGLIIAESCPDADMRMRIFNADGSEAEMCGNGIRCFARFLYDQKIVLKKEMEIETLAGVIRPVLGFTNGEVTGVTVDMGKPVFENEKIPVLPGVAAQANRIRVLGRDITVSTILMGVPHTVVFTHENEGLDPAVFGPAVETYGDFPKKTNVNFVEVVNDTTLRNTTWERGAGLTLACGTGCCAAAVVSAIKGYTQKNANVLTQTGQLVIEYKDTGTVFMTGPAEYVFSGEAQSPYK